jgi:Polyketide cyclase / dehydrase and lipid transport
MRQLTVTCPVAVDPRRVIDALWSGTEWQSRWAGVRSFAVSYDDGTHQDARLTLDWDGELVGMEVVRFRTGPSCIDFFCPRPPPPLAHQSGRWSVEPGAGGNVLVATRTVALALAQGESAAESERRQDEYVGRLQDRLGRILAAFARGLE